MSIIMRSCCCSSALLTFQINCSSSDSKPPSTTSTSRRGGFGGVDSNNNNSNYIKTNKAKAANDSSRRRRINQQLQTTEKAPRIDAKSAIDLDFEQRLQAVTRSALEKKKAEEVKDFSPIDYDAAPVPSHNNPNQIGFATKIGVGVAVVVFGLVFAFGDFLPSPSPSVINPNQENSAVVKLSEEDKATLQSRLKEFEATLSNSPRDPTALEGAAVTLAELGEYARAASLLDDLTKEKPNDAEVFRLLGEVKYELKDYEGSVAAYKTSAEVSKDIKFEILRGLTNSFLAAKKPDEAVQFLLACRERLSSENLSKKSDSSPTDSQKLDPIQVELLLGKAYSDWGHVSDAVAVYDQLISTHPDDFRGYLAKGIILKENKNIGDAERMFIQARFFAPDKAKALVDRYSR
ncbi:hypothetical protein RIF29_28402 [Crotalaria pallida]|uniref:Uncharacterized protein n=1 Tax=Crotalaria pallida TaxID=3830 RepID=A0AAN9EJB1_CROPI